MAARVILGGLALLGVLLALSIGAGTQKEAIERTRPAVSVAQASTLGTTLDSAYQAMKSEYVFDERYTQASVAAAATGEPQLHIVALAKGQPVPAPGQVGILVVSAQHIAIVASEPTGRAQCLSVIEQGASAGQYRSSADPTQALAKGCPAGAYG